MPKTLTRLSLLVALTGATLAACKKEAALWQPATTTPPTLREMKAWYAGRSSAAHARLTGTNAARTASATPPDSLNWLAIKWEKLDTITNGTEPLAFLPIEGGAVGISSGYQGYRRVVMGKPAGSPPSGVIIEVLHKGPTLSPTQLNQVFRALYTARQQGQVAQLPGFTGFAAYYTRENYYLAGRAYQAGVPSAGLAWLSSRLAESPGVRKAGTARTNGVEIECISTIIDVSTSLESAEAVIWTCTITGRGGGGSSTSGGNSGGGSGSSSGGSTGGSGGAGGSTGGGGYGGGGTGGYGGGGSGGGGASGGGGSNGPIPNEQYDDGSGNGYGGYSSNGGSANSPTTTTTIISQSLPPCIQSNLTSLQNLSGNDIGGLFKFFTYTPNTSWVITAGSIPPTASGKQINALTSIFPGMPGDFLQTTLNTTFTSTATNVAISRTLIHESLHAYLYRWTYSRGMNVNRTTSQLADAYLATTYPNDIAGQHDAMSSFVNQMASALQADFPNLDLSSGDYAKNLFWAGLTETDAYASLPTTQKNAIASANTAEVLSSSVAKGTKACN